MICLGTDPSAIWLGSGSTYIGSHSDRALCVDPSITVARRLNGQPFERKDRADPDIGVGRSAIDAVYAAENKRIVLCDAGPEADRGRVGQVAVQNIGLVAERRVIYPSGVGVTRVLADKSVGRAR